MSAGILVGKGNRTRGRGLLRFGTGYQSPDKLLLGGGSCHVDWVSSHWSPEGEKPTANLTSASDDLEPYKDFEACLLNDTSLENDALKSQSVLKQSRGPPSLSVKKVSFQDDEDISTADDQIKHSNPVKPSDSKSSKSPTTSTRLPSWQIGPSGDVLTSSVDLLCSKMMPAGGLLEWVNSPLSSGKPLYPVMVIDENQNLVSEDKWCPPLPHLIPSCSATCCIPQHKSPLQQCDEPKLNLPLSFESVVSKLIRIDDNQNLISQDKLRQPSPALIPSSIAEICTAHLMSLSPQLNLSKPNLMYHMQNDVSPVMVNNENHNLASQDKLRQPSPALIPSSIAKCCTDQHNPQPPLLNLPKPNLMYSNQKDVSPVIVSYENQNLAPQEKSCQPSPVLTLSSVSKSCTAQPNSEPLPFNVPVPNLMYPIPNYVYPGMILHENQNPVLQTQLRQPSPSSIPLSIAKSCIAQNVPPPPLEVPAANHSYQFQIQNDAAAYSMPKIDNFRMPVLLDKAAIKVIPPLPLSNYNSGIDLLREGAHNGTACIPNETRLKVITQSVDSGAIKSGGNNGDLSANGSSLHSINSPGQPAALTSPPWQPADIPMASKELLSLRVVAKEFKPKVYLQEIKQIRQDTAPNTSDMSEKVRTLLCYLQNTGQYDSDVDFVNRKLCGLLAEVGSLAIMRSAVEEIYTKSVSDERFCYLGARICAFLACNLSSDFWGLLLERCSVDYVSQRDKLSSRKDRDHLGCFALFLAELMLAHKAASGDICTVFPRYITELMSTLLLTADVDCCVYVIRVLKLAGFALDETEYQSSVDIIVDIMRQAIVDAAFTKSVRLLMMSVLEQRANSWNCSRNYDETPGSGDIVAQSDDAGACWQTNQNDIDSSYLMDYGSIDENDSLPYIIENSAEEGLVEYWEVEDSLNSSGLDYFESYVAGGLDDEVDDMDPEIAAAYEIFLRENAVKK